MMRYTCRIGLNRFGPVPFGPVRFGVAPKARCVFSRDTAIRTTEVPLAQTTRWRAVVRVLRSPIDSLSCALLPSSCALCGSPLPQLSSVPICPVCWSEFPVQSGPVCARCGDAIAASARPTVSTLCRTCRLAPPPFVRAVSHGVYEGRMREAIHALKYDRLHSAARELGRMLAGAIAQLAGEAPAEMLVVPVPLHRSKYAQRGFNQSRSLAAAALEFLRISHPQWRLTLAPSTLMRLRATGSQADLNSHQRRLNVLGAFSVSNPSKVTARNILLVDDILTTGATARAAAQTLLNAGAASVWVATLARSQRSTGFGRHLNSAHDEDNEEDGEILTGPPMQVDPHAALSDSSTLRKQPSSF